MIHDVRMRHEGLRAGLREKHRPEWRVPWFQLATLAKAQYWKRTHGSHRHYRSRQGSLGAFRQRRTEVNKFTQPKYQGWRREAVSQWKRLAGKYT